MFVKSRIGAPSGFFEAEAFGLQWLSEPNINPISPHILGARVAKVFDYNSKELRIEKITSTRPTVETAKKFGEALAYTHYSLVGSEKFGFSPSPHNFFGPLSDPIEMPTEQYDDFWSYFIRGRMQAICGEAIHRGEMSPSDWVMTEKTLFSLREKYPELSDQALYPPQRVHGDLWSGNLLWSEEGAVLIDPSAHAGLGLEDLALLGLFGCPFYQEILAAYFDAEVFTKGASDLVSSGEQNALNAELTKPTKPTDLKEIFTMLNLFSIAGHVAFFGGSYYSQYMSMLRSLA